MNKDTSPIEPGLMPFVKLQKKVSHELYGHLNISQIVFRLILLGKQQLKRC